MTDPYTSLQAFIVRQRMEHYAHQRAQAQHEGPPDDAEEGEPNAIDAEEHAPAQNSGREPA